MLYNDLMTSQKNELFKIIIAYEFEPDNFTWERGQSDFIPGSTPILAYKGTNFHLKFDQKDGRHYATYSPGEDTLLKSVFPGAWLGLSQYFRQWLTFLKREILQPDLWGDLSKYQILDPIQTNADNRPFTVLEYEQITSGINQMRAYIQSYGLANNEQMELVNEKFDYLLEAAKRQGRTDWVHTCVGILVSVSASCALAPEQTKTIWGILKNAITGVVKFLTS